MKEKLEKIIKAHGENNQKLKAIEELDELQIAILNDINKGLNSVITRFYPLTENKPSRLATLGWGDTKILLKDSAEILRIIKTCHLCCFND